MRRTKFWPGLAGGLGLLVLILDSRTALAGAREGVALCLQTVIPSLFPFFVLGTVVTGAWAGTSPALLRPVGRLCGMPRGAEAFLVSGFLGGYPVGAQAIAQAWREGRLEKQDAQRLLGFCNNAGPAFLFGMAASLFPKLWMAWVLWGIHIVSAVLTALLLPKGPGNAVQPAPSGSVGLPEAMKRSHSAMVSVCGWVILFRVVIAFLQRWFLWLLPVPVQAAVMGILELTNGCCALAGVESLPLRFLLCAGMLSFGGLCVTMQTLSVTAGLDIKPYILGKLLQTLFSLILAAAVAARSAPLFLGFFLVALPLFWMRQKRCSIFPKTAV